MSVVPPRPTLQRHRNYGVSFEGIFDNKRFCREHQKKLSKLTELSDIMKFLQLHHPLVGSAFVGIPKHLQPLARQSLEELAQLAHVIVMVQPQLLDLKTFDPEWVEWRQADYIANLAYLALHAKGSERDQYLILLSKFQETLKS